ncbi:hypothetical protein GCM10011391_19260 [Pullulanibacillus camelliae]|uniref:DUF4083 domain-containing protein n=1 Tax=Pullulanibacillus camelliae TaxID=1707096 RepID=A0A8J2YGR1_9BACL|nr:LapA family protein [Pullulanibacillus camelliae]GGE40621.1 hypothetical protein GCM10011391_19260 [Pullulanibacillus camelliae]
MGDLLILFVMGFILVFIIGASLCLMVIQRIKMSRQAMKKKIEHLEREVDELKRTLH